MAGSRDYPIEEFEKLLDVIKEIPGVTAVAARNWVREGKYPAAIRRGKYWLVHPKQFKLWWSDGGPQPS